MFHSPVAPWLFYKALILGVTTILTEGVIVGEEDWINQPGQAEEMQKLIPKSKLVILKESGHLVWVDQYDMYAKCIAGFLRETIERN